MEPVNQGFTNLLGVPVIICSDNCKAVIGNDPECNTRFETQDEKYLTLLSVQGYQPSVLFTHTIIQATVCAKKESNSTCGRPYALVQLRTKEEHFFFSVYLANDFSPVEPIDDFPPGFSFKLFKESNIFTQVVQKSLQHTNISVISQLLTSRVMLTSNIK